MVNMSYALSIIVLSLVMASVNASLIFDAAEVKATPGESLTLSCGVKQEFSFCIWDHENGRSFQATAVHKGVHPGMRAPEDLTDNQCGIVIDSVSIEDSGEWTCRVFLADGRELRGIKTLAACHSPFVIVGNECLYFHEGYMNWNDAKDYCRSLSSSEYNSDLATVDSCEQLGDIHQHILLEYSPLWHWIGGTDSYEESDWHWLTGGTVPVSTPFWYPGHPLLNTTLNCLALQQYTGYFFDYSCTSHGPFICEEFSVAT
ncbi:hypothetical protein OTU49_017526 [Cherax quadricarinatus]|uniref:Uncharacterized protein n=1 Tax=Cherax quadricarinatus TaxID=27406 RepID=A0AAW0YBK5_CHEQU